MHFSQTLVLLIPIACICLTWSIKLGYSCRKSDLNYKSKRKKWRAIFRTKQTSWFTTPQNIKKTSFGPIHSTERPITSLPTKCQYPMGQCRVRRPSNKTVHTGVWCSLGARRFSFSFHPRTARPTHQQLPNRPPVYTLTWLIAHEPPRLGETRLAPRLGFMLWS